MNWTEVEARFLTLQRLVAHEFEVQAGNRNFCDGSTQAGTRCLKRRKKGQRESSECKRFRSTESYTRAEEGRKEGRKEGEERRMGGTGITAYPHRHRPIHNGLPTRTTTSTWGSGGSCMLKMQTEGGVGSLELATPVACGLSTSTK